MFENQPGQQRELQRAVDESDAASQDITEIRRELKAAMDELAHLKAFSRKLLTALELKFGLDVPDLDDTLRLAEESQRKNEEKSHFHIAPLCPSCARPLQDEKTSCIYCGVAVPESPLSQSHP